MKKEIGTYRLNSKNTLVRTDAFQPRINGRYTFMTRTRRAFAIIWHYTKIAVAILALMLAAAFIGYSLHGNTITTVNTIQLAPPAAPASFPILDRIAAAESHNSQFCTRALAAVQMCNTWEIGAPLVRVNTNGSYDVGMYQINSIHLAQAIALHFDVYTIEGNKGFAQYLFIHEGSEPWNASKKNWI